MSLMDEELIEVLLVIGLEIEKNKKNVYISNETLIYLYNLIEDELISRKEAITH